MSLFKKKQKKKTQSSIKIRFPKRATEDLIFQEIVPGMVYSRVYLNRVSSTFLYELIEPDISPTLYRRYTKLKLDFIRSITEPEKFGDISRDEIPALFMLKLKEDGYKLNTEDTDTLTYYINRDIKGFEKIDGLLKDPNIEDISCDREETPVYIFHRNFGYIATNVKYESEEELNYFIKKMVQDAGKHISIANPIIDATLLDGSRISASIGTHITNKGPTFTIRKFKTEPLTPLDLIQKGLCDSKVFAYFWVLCEYGSNIMVVGGTATGKTTFLNALLLFAPSQKKIVSIEDTREINLVHENWVSMITRNGYGQLDKETGKRVGEIDMFDLLTVTMRQRPSFVVVGEVRGAEAFTVFQAMSIGRYVFATFHADDIETFIHRMESKPINIPRNLMLTLDVVIILSNLSSDRGSLRRIKTVSEITGQDQLTSEIVVNNAFTWNSVTDTNPYSGFSYVLKRIAEKEGKFEADL
ncbi:MAG: type II/IV secretion system ATPase subunit, partial [Thermoplasmataceae archaeon]